MPDASDLPDKQSPSRKDGAVMRRRILDVAAELLAGEGYQAMTLRSIAAAAGLKAGSIYYHFASKEQITVEVLNEGVALVSTAMEEALGALPDHANGKAEGRALLAAAIEAHLAALSAHKAYTRASIRCFSMVPEEVRMQTVETRRAFDTQWLDLLARAQGSGAIRPDTDLKALHLIILGALNWTVEQRRPEAASRKALAATLLDLVTA